MKAISKILMLVAGMGFAVASCDKVDDLPYYGNGSAPTLTASATTIAPTAADSNNTALTLTWTSPKYATDSATVKYVVQIDSTGKNFSRPDTKVITGTRSTSFIAKELNAMLLNRGYAFNVPVDMDVRVLSSYGNNNEQYASNVIKIRMTPYKVPPKVALPTSGKLFIVGSATQGGWNNPVPVPSQEFARLDETTFAGIFQLNGNSEYLILPENGNWGKKFAVVDNTVAGLSGGGVFGYHFDGQPAPDPYQQNFPSPATGGWYRIVMDFQQGRFSVTPYTGTMPTTGNLFLVGDATPGGWNNPVPVPAQQMTRVNSSVWEITMTMNGNKEFLVLPENGNWGKKYALRDNSVTGINAGGEFGYHFDGQPAPDLYQQNFKSPSTSGSYKLTLNFAAPASPGASGRFTIQ